MRGLVRRRVTGVSFIMHMLAVAEIELAYLPRIGRVTAFATMAPKNRSENRFLDSIDGYFRLHKLLSEKQRRKMEGIGKADLESCRMDYLELGGIICLHVHFPFGVVECDFFKDLGMKTKHRDVWTTGCLLERSEVSTDALMDLCTNDLGYNPGALSWCLESLRARRLTYGMYRRRRDDHKILARDTLVKKIRGLRPHRITAEEYMQRQAASDSDNQIYVWDKLGDNRYLVPKKIGVTDDPDEIDIHAVTADVTGSKAVKQDTLVYLPVSGGPTKFAKVNQTFSDYRDLYEKLNTLMPVSKRDELKDITPADLLSCDLDYLEVGRIISKYVDYPFGGLWPSRLYFPAGGSNADFWTTGCLLQKAKLPMKKLRDFCTETLKFTPPQKKYLQCLMRSRSRPTRLIQFESSGGPRRFERLLEDVKGISISVDQFVERQFDVVRKCQDYMASMIALKQADAGEGVIPPKWHEQVYSAADGNYALHGYGLVKPLVLKDSAEAKSFAVDILPQFKRAGLASEMKIKDVLQCSLDYVELACVIMKYIITPFGSLTSWGHRKFLECLRSSDGKLPDVLPDVLHNVDAWIGGCILRAADVPLVRLKIACLDKLKYRPHAVRYDLECLKRKTLPFDEYKGRLSADYRDNHSDYLNGFKGKHIAAVDFFRMLTLPQTEKDRFIRLWYRPVLGPQNSGMKRDAEEAGLPNQGVKKNLLEQVASQGQQPASQEQVIADQLMHTPIDQLTDKQTVYLLEGSGEIFWGSGVPAHGPNRQTVPHSTEPSTGSVLGVFAEEMQRITPHLPEFGGLSCLSFP